MKLKPRIKINKEKSENKFGMIFILFFFKNR